MAIATNCPHCDRSYKLAGSAAGKNVRCKDCGNPFLVAAAGATSKPAVGLGEKRVPQKTHPAGSEWDDDNVEDVVAADDDEPVEEKRPVRKAKALKRAARPRKEGGSSGAVLLVLGGGAVALLLLCVGGGGLLYVSGALGTGPVKIGDGGGIGIPPLLQPQPKPGVQILTEAADILETIKDKPSLDAAQPKLHAVGLRLQLHKPVLATAIFLSKEAPGMPPQMAEQFAAQVEKDPKFQPYLVEGKALLADPAFRPAYRRYNIALLAAYRVPDAEDMILKEFQIKF